MRMFHVTVYFGSTLKPPKHEREQDDNKCKYSQENLFKKKVHEEFIKKTYSKLSRTPKDVN